MNAQYRHLPIIAFATLGIIWGSNFIYTKMAYEFIAPLQIVFWRVLFGFIPVAIYAGARGALKIEHLKYIRHFFVMSLLATCLYYYGFAKGTSLLYSGVAGILSGSIPLFSFLLAVVFLADEKVTVSKLSGIIIGFIGIIFIARPFELTVDAINLEGAIYMILGSLSVGGSFIYAKKYITPLNISPLALVTYQLGLSVIILSLITDRASTLAVFHDIPAALGLVVGLGLLGTGLAYILYYYLIHSLGAVRAASATYLPPIVALFIGAVIVGEPIEAFDYLASLCIFASIYLLHRKSNRA